MGTEGQHPSCQLRAIDDIKSTSTQLSRQASERHAIGEIARDWTRSGSGVPYECVYTTEILLGTKAESGGNYTTDKDKPDVNSAVSKLSALLPPNNFPLLCRFFAFVEI